MPYTELKIVTKKTLEDAADAIRTKLGTSDKIAPEDFDDSIGDIPTGITPTGTKSITANGTGIDVTEYAAVDVAVPTTTPTGTLQISQNGTYDVTKYASAAVNCPSALMLGYNGDFWESAGDWNKLPPKEMPTPVGQDAVLSIYEGGQEYPTPSEGDVVIACGTSNPESGGGAVNVAGIVESYEKGAEQEYSLLTIKVAAMSSK